MIGVFGSGSTSRRPNVGQSGAPSSLSKSQTGKFESIPPSTITCCWFVSGFSICTGSKKIGIDMLIRTASATASSSGFRPRSPASRGSTSSFRALRSEATTWSRYWYFGSSHSVFTSAKVCTPLAASRPVIHFRNSAPS